MEKKKDILTVVFGLPGSGKSSLAAYLARHAMKKGIKVYSNFFVEGALQIDKYDLGTYEISHGLVLIDEAGLSFNARDWKKFTDAHQSFFRYYRHHYNQVYVFSQSWNSVDKVIRDVAWRYMLVKPSLIKGIVKTRTMGMEPISAELDATGNPNPRYFWVKFSLRYWPVFLAWKSFYTHSAPSLPEKAFPVYSKESYTRQQVLTADESASGGSPSSARPPEGAHHT